MKFVFLSFKNCVICFTKEFQINVVEDKLGFISKNRVDVRNIVIHFSGETWQHIIQVMKLNITNYSIWIPRPSDIN